MVRGIEGGHPTRVSTLFTIIVLANQVYNCNTRTVFKLELFRLIMHLYSQQQQQQQFCSGVQAVVRTINSTYLALYSSPLKLQEQTDSTAAVVSKISKIIYY